MHVTMTKAIGGFRNGEPWPAAGGVIELPDHEAADMIANGYAKEATDHDLAAEDQNEAPADDDGADATGADGDEAPADDDGAPPPDDAPAVTDAEEAKPAKRSRKL